MRTAGKKRNSLIENKNRHELIAEHKVDRYSLQLYVDNFKNQLRALTSSHQSRH